MADEPPDAGRLDAVEARLAYQDQTIDDLNEAVTRQWREIDALSHAVARLEAQLREAMESRPAAGQNEPPPPHY